MSGDENNDGDSLFDVSTARNRLEGALEKIVERDTKSESSDSTDEFDVDIKEHASDTKRKTPTRQPPRKKRKKALKPEPFQQTCVMKLYDRSVDLAQFSADTPLYPVCRAWMQNDPANLSMGISPSKKKSKYAMTEDKILKGEGEGENAELKDITTLPPPELLTKDEIGKPVDVRIPKPLGPGELSNLEFMTQEPTKGANELLRENLNHWATVRKEWKLASKRNETRYAKSIQQLKTIYDKNSQAAV